VVMIVSNSIGVNGVLIVVAFNSSWFARSRSDDSSWIARIGACALGDFVANLQLLSPDLVRGWMNPGLRMALSLVDGLLDEQPGIVVIVTLNQLRGGVLWGRGPTGRAADDGGHHRRVDPA